MRTIPVYMFSMVFSICLGYTAEYLRKRYLFCMIGFLTMAIGLIVEIAQPPAPGVRYMGLFFMIAGAYIVMPLIVVWLSINIDKGYKRSVALGLILCLGNIGSFINSNVFMKREEPHYHTGFSTNLGLCGMGMLAATILFVGMYFGNKKRDRNRKDLPDSLEQASVEGLGERHPDFRYYL